MLETERINKYLANCGVCSRREADKLIEEGRVKVNGQIAVAGLKVSENDEISINNKIIGKRNDKVVLAYYKPVGVTCTEKDKYADKIITDVIQYPVRVTYAGRLDKDSEGLILLTNDGDLINALMKASNFHEKEYIVKVDREINDAFIEKMSKGLYLKDLKVQTRECKVEKLGKYTFSIVLTQGVNRQIRRMCMTLGYKVKALKRIRIANILLADLKNGEYRELSDNELRVLYKECNKNCC